LAATLIVPNAQLGDERSMKFRCFARFGMTENMGGVFRAQLEAIEWAA
jgi:hypothetical protein